MIPKNDTDQEKIARQNEKQFRKEVDKVEKYIFSKEWATKSYDNTPMPGHIWAGCVKEFSRDKQPFVLTDEHWDTIVKEIKEAGYYVYRKWYHNGFYGTTRVYDHCISKTPLTTSQRVKLRLQEDWSTPCGPGREQMRGERL